MVAVTPKFTAALAQGSKDTQDISKVVDNFGFVIRIELDSSSDLALPLALTCSITLTNNLISLSFSSLSRKMKMMLSTSQECAR